ncbi:MAG TPA: autotransporter-associated beta strand repeat-containing protein [Kiritimatiellia bacterium]|nr:autotransporter-associated beta strand repeat-containing protein [Kiritimatiellia bacterium]HRU71644.1 autotransporter-associated beta strand repeat-containing protein [Kiritimatiellia bacterium]
MSAPLTALNGAFIKSGAGTLTLDGPGTFAFGSYHNGMAHDFEGFPANGDSPTRCFTAFTVSQGKIVWGEPGQVVTIGNNVWIGTRNANGPGEAVTGEVEINGGTTTINGSIFIGVANGDPISAPVPLHPRLTINGGDTTVSGSLNMGWDNRTTTATYYGTQQAHNAQPELVVNGGVLRIHGEFYPSYHGGVSPTNRVTINGGELHARRAYFGHDRFGEGPAAATIFEINGGLVSLTEDFRMARYVADSFFRFNGGILRAWDIQKADGAGDSQIWFNGGVFQPIWGGQDSVYRTFDRHTNVWVGAGGFIIDTSYWPAPDDAHPAYDINQNISHDPALGDTPDGGIIKRGVSGIVIIRSGQRYSFTGPIMVEEGVLGIEASALWENTLIMHDGTTLRFSNKDLPQVVDSFYAETGTITIDLSFDASTAQSQPLVVSNTLSLAADVIVVGHANGLYVPTLPSGQTTTVLVCNASQTLDAGLFRASPLFPNRLADFNNITLDGGPYAGWQAIVMSVADAPEHVWNATASGGAWDTAGNWLVNAVPPAVPGASVRFPPAAGAAVPVTPADGTLFGRLTLESGPGQGYALSGGTLVPAGPGNDQPTVMTLSGTHTIASPLSVAEQGLWLDTRISATLAVNGPLSGPGRLYANATPSGGGLTVLSGTSTHTGGTEVRSGTLRVENLAALGSPARAANNLLVGPGTFHYTGPSTFTDLGIRFASGAAGRPAIIRVDNDLTLAGPASQANGIFAKFGPGTLRLAYPGTNQFSTSGAGDSNSTTPWPANGDAPAADAGGSGRSFIAEGRFVVGAPGQLFRFNNELDIGCQPRGLGDENTYAVTMDVIGGTIDLSGQYFGIGVNFKRENGVSTYPTVNMYDGTMTIRNLTMAYDTIWKNHSTKATLNIYGGTFNVLEQFRLGHHKGNTSNPPHATVNVYNGAVNHTHASQGTTFGWMNSGDPKPACTGTLNLFGGEFNELWIMKMANHDAISYLNLHGGVLRAENITHVPGSVGQSHVFFNGGVYMPLGTNTAQRTLQGLTSATVSTNGAVIDTSLAAATITFAQPLLHDPALEDTPDGGLIKTGAVDLVLAAASTFTGPAVVQSGTLRATVDGAVPCALHVDADAVFDAAGITHSIARVTGAGLCANGTVRVTERVTPEKVLTFENLTLASGVTHHFGTNVVIAVSGHLSAEGGGFIDFGRTPEAPLTIPHSAVVMTYGTSDAVFSGWRARGTGQPDGKVALRLVRDESGPVKVVRAELIHSGTLMIVQ